MTPDIHLHADVPSRPADPNEERSAMVLAATMAMDRGLDAKGRVLTIQVDVSAQGGWTLHINGTREPVDGIPSFYMGVDWHGFPAGILGPYGDGMLAAGSEANITTLCDALESATS